jgi:catechol 2,3-dioxygenase-like lactoylglutathione lyase family enzyme
MAKLRHLALHTTDLEGAANFYKRVFDMLEVGRNTTATSDGVYLSDGTLNVTILRPTVPLPEFEKFSGPTASGICHFGFLVEDVEETQRRLREAGAVHIDESLPGLVHSEDKWKGPDGVLLDVTDQPWTGALPLSKK